jgi:hypothetical protein
VVSDCAAVADVFVGHHHAPDLAHAAAASVKAGTDLECGFGRGQAYPALVDAVHQGLITEDEIDVSLKRLVRARILLGMFDPLDRFTYGRIPISENNSAGHRAVSLQAARESMTLLRNDNHFLPLKPSVGRIAVVGPTAELVQSLQGNYNGPPPNPVDPLYGIEKRFGRDKVIYAQGSTLVEGFAMPIAHTALHPLQGTGDGLTGEYFNGTDFSGTPVLTRTDRIINFNWDKVVPVPGVGRNNYSVALERHRHTACAGRLQAGCARELLLRMRKHRSLQPLRRWQTAGEERWQNRGTWRGHRGYGALHGHEAAPDSPRKLPPRRLGGHRPDMAGSCRGAARAGRRGSEEGRRYHRVGWPFAWS